MCFESASVYVLVKGNPIDELCMKRGLRQGGPLAPFLFLVVAEGLASLMRITIQKELFSGIKMGNLDFAISCLQFTNDTLFCGDASMQNISSLTSIFRCFEIASRLRVNFYKSNLAGLNVEWRVI